MMKLNTTMKRAGLMTIILVLLLAIFCIESMSITAQAATSLLRPKDIDDGYWVDAYKYYMDSMSDYKGYAILADFDLDGRPELLALADEWAHMGISGCFVKYTGTQYIVFEDEFALLGLDDKLFLAIDSGNYLWYKSRSYANTGLYDESISKLSFSESMRMSENIWFGLYGNMDEGTEEYSIGSRNVSRNEYDQEKTKWDRMTKLFTLDPANYPYPSGWKNAVEEYSVIARSGNNPTIPSQPGGKYNPLDNLGAYIGTQYVVNCDEWVSLRREPNTSSDRLIKVPLGAKVDNCYESDNGFYYCEYNGAKGFVLKKYLASNNPPRPVDNRYDLNQYEYLPVIEKGRGALVFQKSPRGAFMKNHKFYDGDYVYVNVNWRQEGYAIAYEGGDYGYVDASYIDW